MLIQKPLLAVGEILIIKVATGEEIIAKIENVSDIEVEVTKPYRLIIVQGGVSLAPLTLIGDLDRSFHLTRSQIVAYYEVHKDVLPDYLTASTGIALAR